MILVCWFLYLTILLNLLINSNRFVFVCYVVCVVYLGFSTYMITSAMNIDILLFPLEFGYLFFSCLIALAITFNTMLNRNGKSVHTCPFPDLMGKAFRFWPLSMMVVVGFLYMTFFVFRTFLLFLDNWVFSSWNGMEYIQMFYLFQLRWYIFLNFC